MSQPVTDPTRWLTDLMKAQQTVLWPGADITDTKAIADTQAAVAAAAAPWTKATTVEPRNTRPSP